MKNSSRWAGVMILVGMSGVMLAMPAFVSPVRGQDAPATQPTGMRPRGRQSLGGDMRSMDQAFKMIQAQYADPTKNESTLTYLATFETGALAAKSAIPPTINRMADDDKKKARDEYRSMMRNLLRASLDLEDQITAGDMDKAAATIATMQGIEKAGHDEFRPKEN